MRHRIGMAEMTGLGNPAAVLMENNWPTERRRNSLVRRCLVDAVNKFFTRHYKIGEYEETEAWCDFGIDDDELIIGQEPAYQYQHLKVVAICRKKEYSYIESGVAWGAWGSDIAKSRHYYKDYKNKSKFTAFVDRWHPVLFE